MIFYAMEVLDFSNKSLYKQESIIKILCCHLKKSSSVEFYALNPDIKKDIYTGSVVKINNKEYIYYSLKSWIDLAEILECKMSIPQKASYPLVKIKFTKLKQSSFHNAKNSSEKYGVNSEFFKINKAQESAFIYYYLEALKEAKIEDSQRVLNLGVNRGDEFDIIKEYIGSSKFNKKEFVGIDFSKSAIEFAKKRFNSNCTFYCEDLNHIDSLNLGKFDTLISIGTLQSSTLNFKPYFMKLVQNYLNSSSSIILGFPNSRWIGGEVIYGAKIKNYSTMEMGLLINDIFFVKKYLQQKKFKVRIFGKYYIFLVALK